MPKIPPEALESAIAKLKKAGAAGETVGKQTGVDSRSWRELLEKVKSLDPQTLAKYTGGVAATSMAMSQEDAQAAGIDTIAKKLNIGLEEAAKIKKLAMTRGPSDVFEENIKAIQMVSDLKKNPGNFEKIGSGSDVNVYGKDSNVVKVPHSWISAYQPELSISPSVLNLEDLGPKTKNIETSERLYQVQPKLDIPDTRRLNNAEAENLSDWNDRLDQLAKTKLNDLPEAQQIALAKEEADLHKKVSNLHTSRLENITLDDLTALNSDVPYHSDLRSEYPIETIDDAIRDPKLMTALAANHYLEGSQAKKALTPFDIHEYNVGTDPNSKAVHIFDTSRFGQVNTSELTPEMKAATLRDYIAKPYDRQQLKDYMDMPSKASLTKAAAVGGMATSPNDILIKQPLESLNKAYQTVRKPISDAATKAGQYIADLTNPSTSVMRPEQKEQLRDTGGLIGSMAFDPINWVSGEAGLGLAAADVLSSPEEENKKFNSLENRWK